MKTLTVVFFVLRYLLVFIETLKLIYTTNSMQCNCRRIRTHLKLNYTSKLDRILLHIRVILNKTQDAKNRFQRHKSNQKGHINNKLEREKS